MKNEKNIRIEEVGDINYDYPYLEVFYHEATTPFMEIGINGNKQLAFKFYPYKDEIEIGEEDFLYIVQASKDFYDKALKNEEDFLRFGKE